MLPVALKAAGAGVAAFVKADSCRLLPVAAGRCGPKAGGSPVRHLLRPARLTSKKAEKSLISKFYPLPSLPDRAGNAAVPAVPTFQGQAALLG